jgi:hypothetical protein
VAHEVVHTKFNLMQKTTSHMFHISTYPIHYEGVLRKNGVFDGWQTGIDILVGGTASRVHVLYLLASILDELCNRVLKE